MGFLIGIVKKIFKLILYFAIFVAIILLIPNLPPYTEFTAIKLAPSQQRVGPLAPNVVLNNVERLYENKLLGPEAFQIWNGEIYTGLATGEIVKISPGGHVTFVTKVGQPCTGLVQEHICGRPLGFVIDQKNKLMYVADAYHGIWKVNLVTDKKQLLVSPRVPIKGRHPKLFNSLALDKNGDLFWTDSNTDFPLKDGLYTVMSDPTGRLLHYNAVKNESKVLLDKLWFSNGVAISPDNQFVIVSESNKYRVMKYYINGPKKGTSEVFVDGLPGIPDNIRPLPDGSGVLIALYNVFDDESPLITKTMAGTPMVRKLLARLARLIEIPFEFLNSQFQHHLFEEIIYKIGSLSSISGILTPPEAGLLQIDWNGNIIASYYNNDSTVYHISDAIVFNDKLYMGCPHNQNYIAAVPAPPLLKKAFKESKPIVSSKEQEIKTNEIPKPDNTRPKQPDIKPKIVPKVQEKPKEVPKVQEKPKEIPKVQEKPKEVPKVQEKPKEVPRVQEKPKEVPKVQEEPKEVPKLKEPSKEVPKVQEKPKEVPKVQEKPKEVPKVQEKPKVAPKPQEKPKEVPKVQEKPKEVPKVQEKPKEAPKPQEKPKEVPKAQEKPKETPKPQEKPKEVPKAQEKPKETPKSQEKPKVQEKPKEVPKAQEKPKEVPKPNEEPKVEKPSKPIPVQEEIPSDTVKPSKEKLKVIKKNGPQEIPNPHL